MSGFGAGFRKAREALGVSIDVVASETRIGSRFLRAIESEEFDILPGGLFNRGFIRTYAERLGLDPDQAVEDYQRLVRDREAHEPEPASYRPSRSGMPNWAIIAGIAALIIAALVYALLLRDAEPAEPREPSGVNPAKAAPVPPPAPIQNTTAPPVETPASPSPQSKAPEPPAPIKAPLDIEMRVNELTWIQVFADGAPTDVGEFPPGTTRRYSAQKSIEMKVGNAGGVMLKVNDREILSLGKPGEVRQFKITPENASQFGATPGN
jgi:hypothetical protein